MCFLRLVRVLQTPKTPLQLARQRLSQGLYYSDRTDEVLEKARNALDGYVGPAMNIMHDNEERNVSRLGASMSAQLRRGDRYLTRSEVNQSAYNKALSEAADSLQLALEQAVEKKDKAVLTRALGDLDRLRSDNATESRIETINGQFSEGKTRLEDVEQDAPGRDVSHHGRPIWNLFEQSQRDLDSARTDTQSDKTRLEAVIGNLEGVNPDGPDGSPSSARAVLRQ